MEIVGVLWGTDTGIVDLTNNRVLFYMDADSNGSYWGIPYVYVEDSDFAVLADWGSQIPDEETYELEIAELANWSNVCRLLQHPSFKNKKQHPCVNLADLKPGDLFKMGNCDTLFAKKDDGHYIAVNPGPYGKVGDLYTGHNENVIPVKINN